jgi:hypothetical protein
MRRKATPAERITALADTESLIHGWEWGRVTGQRRRKA